MDFKEFVNKLEQDLKDFLSDTYIIVSSIGTYLKDPDRMKFLRDMQKRYGLLASAGGDRHREGQPFCTGGDYILLEKLFSTLKKVK